MYMKKRLTTILALMLTIVGSAQAQEFESAKDAVKNMGVGWNLGNTLDAHNQKIVDINDKAYWGQQGLESETCWGQPKATRELIHMMKEAGFGAIRVPVTWYNHMDSNRMVDQAWLARVKEVVDYVLDEGLYCIINVHHDTGADSYDKNGNLTGSHWIHADYNTDLLKTMADLVYYASLWTTIAREFYDYGPKLLFESQNETLDKLNSWCFASFNAPGQYDEEIAKSAYTAINEFNKAFVTSVRTLGNMSPTGEDVENAKNDKRNLIINTYGACNGSGNWNKHLKDPLTNLEIPDGEKNHIIVEVHAYPSIVNGSTNKGITTIKSETKELMDGLKTNFVSKGIPVIIGEWGTSNVDAATTDYAARRGLMLEFVDDFVKQAKDNNIATFYWMGLSDGHYRSMPAFNQADLAEKIVKAYHGASHQGKYPTPSTAAVDYVVTYTADWQELNLYSGSAIKLSDYKGIRVEMDNDSYVGKLQVKIYAGSGGSDSAQPLTGASSTITFDAATTGSNTQRITLQTMIGAQKAVLRDAFLIKKDGTEEKTEISVFWGCTLETQPRETAINGVQGAQVDDGVIYNLAGQRISKPTKGVYIQNGQKYIAK